MSYFRSLLRKKSSKLPQIGIAENENCYCLVYFEQERPMIIWQTKPFDIQDLLQQAVRNSQDFTIIRPIPYHYIWRKILVLPQDIEGISLHQKILQALQQELPILLTEIYFDTLQSLLPEQNLVKVQIFALKRSYADPLLLTQNTILDCELHCYQRGLLYENNESNIDQFQLHNKQFEFKNNGLEISSSSQATSAEQEKHNLYLTALGAALWSAA